MPVEIIGSGFGRTGMMTLKDALGALGFGPTHHMTEVYQNPSQLAHWKAWSAKSLRTRSIGQPPDRRFPARREPGQGFKNGLGLELRALWEKACRESERTF